MKSLLVASAALAAMGLSSAHAAATILTFDGAHGEIVDVANLAFVESIDVVNNDGSAPQDTLVIFDTETNTPNGDGDLLAPFFEAPFDINGTEIFPGGIAIIPDQDDPLADDEALGGIITFVFTVPVTMDSIRFFDASTVEVTLFSDKGSAVEIGSETVTGLDDVVDNPKNVNKTDVLDLSAYVDVLSLQIDLSGTSGGFDNVSFVATPVPGALPLMIGGVALVGFAARRRRQH
ncbi:MAG: hypothetical protein AAF225_11850 [Pseudomonadota bacterium]